MSTPSPPKLPDGTHTDFKDALGCSDYLRLDTLLGSQKPLTEEHDELLFIIIHQASELWLKLVVHELAGARDCLAADDLRPAFKMLARIAAIQTQLIQSWSVLSTLTPADYLRFRDALGHASGLQSHQYRQIEFFLGNKSPAFLAPHAHTPEIHQILRTALDAPSLYDEAILLLARRGFAIDEAVIARDWAEPHVANDSVMQAWLAIYRDTQTHWGLYELAEKLLDLEDSFQQWRFRHLETVKRIIGFKRGTGAPPGSAIWRAHWITGFFRNYGICAPRFEHPGIGWGYSGRVARRLIFEGRQAMGIKVVGLMHTGVRITPEDGDVEKALSIWQDMLGLKIDSSRPDFPDIPGAWLNFAPNGADQGEPPQQIHIFGANGTSPRARTKREDPTRPHVALAVESLDDAKRELESRDIDYWIYSGLVGAASEQVFFEDGFGNMIELQEAPA